MTGKLQRTAALSIFASAAIFGGVASAQTVEPAAPIDLGTAIQSGTPILEFRPRYESVQAFGRADAEAFTMRTRLGWQTQKWNNLVGLIEFEDVRQLGGSDYDDGIAPNENYTTAPVLRYATIQDPDVTELNRLQLTWTPNDWLTVTAGRQRIILDDQRFVGSVAWRQDEQTFDALRLDADFGRLDVMYAYVGHVNRIAAEDLDYGSNSSLLNVSYTFSDPLKVTAFYYDLDNHDDIETGAGPDVTATYATAAENASNTTYGVRVSGNTWVGRFRLNYAATYATQSDNGHALNEYDDIEYYGGEFSATLGPTTARLAYESLGSGDATNKITGVVTHRGFATPFATLHAFQGWADVFLTTPADGINDLNGSVTFNPRWRRDHLFNINLLARYHDFTFEQTGDDIGREWDLSASANITRRLSWIVKYADFTAENDIATGTNATPSTTKTWFGLEFKL